MKSWPSISKASVPELESEVAAFGPIRGWVATTVASKNRLIERVGGTQLYIRSRTQVDIKRADDMMYDDLMSIFRPMVPLEVLERSFTNRGTQPQNLRIPTSALFVGYKETRHAEKRLVIDFNVGKFPPIPSLQQPNVQLHYVWGAGIFEVTAVERKRITRNHERIQTAD